VAALVHLTGPAPISIPIAGREAEEVASVAQHPAARAWRKLSKCPVVPESIEFMQECRHVGLV
jgi:hypothetical protein